MKGNSIRVDREKNRRVPAICTRIKFTGHDAQGCRETRGRLNYFVSISFSARDTHPSPRVSVRSENSPGRHSSRALLRSHLLPRDLLVRQVATVSENGPLMMVVMADRPLVVLGKRQLRQILSELRLAGQQLATHVNVVRCGRRRRRRRRVRPRRWWRVRSRYHGVFVAQVLLVSGWQTGLKDQSPVGFFSSVVRRVRKVSLQFQKFITKANGKTDKWKLLQNETHVFKFFFSVILYRTLSLSP